MSAPWGWSNESEGPAGLVPDEKGYFRGYRLAPWRWRVVAGLIDWLLLVAIPWWIMGYFLSQYMPVDNANNLALVGAGAIAFFNSGYMAARTTQSFGKRVCGIQMVHCKLDQRKDSYVSYVSVPLAIFRLILHYPIDWLVTFSLGFWLIPIINKSNGTVSDFMCKTLHYKDPNLPPPIDFPKGVKDWI